MLVSSLFSANLLLKNAGVIDIGHKEESSEIEVPKQLIISEPSMQITNNVIVYAEREFSDEIDCETDFMDIETCPVEQSVCPSNEERVSGYSIANSVTKSFIKICPFGSIKVNDRCYRDENRDGVIDTVNQVVSSKTLWSNVVLNMTNCKDTTETFLIGTGGWITARHHSWSACDGDLNTVTVKVNNVVKINVGCNSARDTGDREIYRNNSGANQHVTVYYKDCHSGTGWDHSTMERDVYGYSSPPPAGWTIDGSHAPSFSFYKSAVCPANTVELSDGSCQMTYNWYSYFCPAETNEYANAWNVVDAGSDCGNISCTNSATPPVGNCVRLNYTCPIDANAKCGKTLNNAGVCNDGYVWNSNRCERIESYCGDSFYNAVLDVCQDITKYTKLCQNQSEVYNKNTDKCESPDIACVAGEYSEEINKCTMSYITKCPTFGYQYNYLSGRCENASAPPCKTQYGLTNGMCLGQMNVCQSGYSYNETSRKCQKNTCGLFGTADNGQLCAKNASCAGTISNGKCIPTTVQ